MKKYISILISLVIIFFTTSVFATISFDVLVEANKNTLKASDEVEVIVKLNNFTEKENGINVLMATLDYDRTVFETIKTEDISSIQFWDTPTFNQANGKLVIDASKFINESHNAFKVKLKVKESIQKSATTQFKVKDIMASDSESDISSKEAVVEFQVQKSGKQIDDIKGETVKSKYNIYLIGSTVGAVVLIGVGLFVIIRKKK